MNKIHYMKLISDTAKIQEYSLFVSLFNLLFFTNLALYGILLPDRNSLSGFIKKKPDWYLMFNTGVEEYVDVMLDNNY